MTDSLTIYHKPEPHPDISTPDPHQDAYSRNTFGFWVYLMTDSLIFATLFCTFAVLHDQTFGGPSSNEIFSLPLTFGETMALLFSSLTGGLAMLSALKNDQKKVVMWLVVTFFFGASFVAMELTEFSGLVAEGHSWSTSAFLSSFFALVGTHGLHVSVGLLWISVMAIQVSFYGITPTTFRRLVIWNMFWHFLDLVWIFIFTFVYLIGVL